MSLGTALIQSRLDYSNSVLCGTSVSNLHKLQMVQNALARTIIRSPHSVPTSQLLSNLHWLTIHKRINFKVAILTYKVLSTQQPAYLYNLISYHQASRSLRSSSQVPRVKPISDVVLSPLLLLISGIIYLPPLKYLHYLTPSNVTSTSNVTLFYLAIIFSPPSDSPAPLI